MAIMLAAAPLLNTLLCAHSHPTRSSSILHFSPRRQRPSLPISAKPCLRVVSVKAPTTSVETGTSWDQLVGSNDWEGLLDPLDLSLREFIIRCGELCQATYDSFDNDQNSKYCGACRYGMHSMLEKVMLTGASNYEVSAYLYATACASLPEALLLHSLSRESWEKESNWIGYIAVTTDEVSKARGRREIYVVWRGTCRSFEWINELGIEQISAKELLPKGNGGTKVKIMLGWATIYTSEDPTSAFTKASARKQVHSHLKQLLNKYKDEKVSVIVTGHSLGGSLAVLSSFDMVVNQVVPPDVTVTTVGFACPRLGNRAFNEEIEKHSNLRILQVKNIIDLIPHVPGTLFGYVDTGTEMVIDTRTSPHLKHSMNAMDWHNLEGYLHVVSGWNGPNGEFEQKVKRCLALVNKSCDFLKPECLVPASWWMEKNRGMIRNEHGEWMTASPAEEDLPAPPVLHS